MVETNEDKVLYINMPFNGPDLSSSTTGAFEGNTNITTVYMGSGVTYYRIPPSGSRYEYYDHGLKARTFRGCTNLKTVVLPDTITAIFDDTFRNCTSLETITIPKNVLHISSYAFAGTGIKYVYIHEALDTLLPNAFSNDCIVLYEGEKAHENWKNGWDTLSK